MLIFIFVAFFQLLGLFTVSPSALQCQPDLNSDLNSASQNLIQTEDGLECPTWTLKKFKTMDCNSNHSGSTETPPCTCAESVEAIVICDPVSRRAYLHLGYCMSYDEDSNMTVFGACIYNSFQVYSTINYKTNATSLLQQTHAYYPLPMNKSELSRSCEYLNRKGKLCGKCKEGFSPPLLSYNFRCINCSGVDRVRTWMIICARIIGPITVLYVLALVFRCSALSPKLNGFILFAQYISSPPLIRQAVLLMDGEPDTAIIGRKIVYTIFSMYSWCNLDFFSLFFPPLCDPNFNTFAVFTLNFVLILYPMLLVLLTYLLLKLYDRGNQLVRLLCRPCIRAFFFSFRKNWNIRYSLIDVFASVILLSYVRFIGVSLDMLTVLSLRDIHGHRVGTFYWQYDASLEVFRSSALLVVVPSILIVLTVFFFPTLLLCCCSLRHLKIVSRKICCNSSYYLALHTFMDAFQGHYTDGTEPGTYNCRFVAPLYLFLRVCLYLAYTLIIAKHYHIFTIILGMLYAVLIAIIRPYKKEHALQNVMDPVFFMLFCFLKLGIVGVILFQTEHRDWLSPVYICVLIISILPLVYLAVLALHWFANTKPMQQALGKVAVLFKRKVEEETTPLDENKAFNVWIMRNKYGSAGH